MSAECKSGETLAGAHSALRVQVVFHVSDEGHAQTLAAQLVDRAHEIANQPQCECDVDVSIEWVVPDDAAGLSGRGSEPARGHPAER